MITQALRWGAPHGQSFEGRHPQSPVCPGQGPLTPGELWFCLVSAFDFQKCPGVDSAYCGYHTLEKRLDFFLVHRKAIEFKQEVTRCEIFRLFG